jgi:hypothetical protein
LLIGLSGHESAEVCAFPVTPKIDSQGCDPSSTELFGEIPIIPTISRRLIQQQDGGQFI